jgi:phosphoribosylanthranilate isomerase
MFQIKICGVTRPEDAVVASEAGADAIGLNFFDKSPRFVDDARAAEIIAALPASVAKVGVFVNAGVVEIRRKVEQLGLDWVQLHGDEPPQLVMMLGGLPVLRAIRLKERSQKIMPLLRPPMVDFIRMPTALLIDAYSPSAYGGTGETVAWDEIPRIRKEVVGLPVVLAGGLTAENVAEAIRVSGANAVDTASGVEASPGIKDHDKIRAFVAAAKQAFAPAPTPEVSTARPDDWLL